MIGVLLQDGSSMSEDTVLVCVDAAVATVTLNRGADRWEGAGVSLPRHPGVDLT
jgi:hypothetical protein